VPEGTAFESLHPDAHDYITRNPSLFRDLPVVTVRAIERAARADLEQKVARAATALQEAERRHQTAIAAAAAQLTERQTQYEIGMARAAASWDMVDEQLRSAALEVERARQQQAAALADVDRMSRREADISAQLAQAVAARQAIETRLAEADALVTAANARADHERHAAAEQLAQRQRAFDAHLADILRDGHAHLLREKAAEIKGTATDLRTERAQLAELRAKLALSRRVLSVRLTELYKADRPDFITVVLNSHGFADLLERSEFMERINDQDLRIIRTVRVARDASQRASARLAILEARQQAITTAVLVRRNEVARVRLRLVDKRREYARARAAKAEVLGRVRSEREGIQEDLAAMEREQARIRGVLVGGGGPAGPVRRGSGGFIWPVNGPITGVFGENRGDHFHAGVDISASSGTPIRGAASGTVAIASWTGGYGNFTCIQHTGVMSTCYAHQSRFAVSLGQSVSQGQVIGYSGCTGLCFGPHLHFEVRINGAVTNPLNYL